MNQTPIRILLIEDEPECGLMMEAFLRSASKTAFSFSLERGETLAAGLALLREKEFDVVLLDLNLPDSRGLDTLREVKARGRGMTIVVLTGLRDDDLGRQAIAQGAQDFLSKGEFSSETLRHVVRFAYERGRMLNEFEHVLECSPDGVVVAGDDGFVRYANPSAAVLFDTPLRDLVGRPFGHAFGPEKPAELTLKSESGRERVVEMCPARVEWRGEPAWLVTARDVTVLKMVSAARATGEERQKQGEARERFLQAVTHDLRSPLHVVAAVVECLVTFVPETAIAERRLVETGRGALKRVLRLAENLLGLWQLESGRMTVYRAPLEMGRICEAAVQEARLAHPNKDIKLDFGPDLPQAFGDEDMVARMLTNLLDNACRFARSTVTVSGRREAPGRVSLVVADDGPGVAEAKVGGLFDRFSQGERFMDESGYKGTGLGLAVCREIAQLHDGSIAVESSEGKGATFRVTLPACSL
ncbi:MAG: response regulator [Elusimicrobia bacterium]|nr:response regulator [Elusimicrobiota bacterium]